MYYAGIGSRDTPKEVLELMEIIGQYLGKRDFILRSGGAKGADYAFETGCDKSNGKKEIFIPWKGFNNSKSNLIGVSDEALKLAEKYHPAWDRCSKYAKILMARNSYQVLGKDLHTNSDFVICYTNNGKKVGGTAQAIRIAEDNNIPVFNFGCYKSVEDMKKEFNKFYKTILK